MLMVYASSLAFINYLRICEYIFTNKHDCYYLNEGEIEEH